MEVIGRIYDPSVFLPAKKTPESFENEVGGPQIRVYYLYGCESLCDSREDSATKHTYAELFLAGSLLRACSQRRNLKISYKISCMDKSYTFTEA